MPRPRKNSAEYFTHDVGMRNDDKVLALRSKFPDHGYSVWNMMLEVLAGSDGFFVYIDEIKLELLAGDFRVSASEIQEILSFCVRINLLQENQGVYKCENLVERLSPMVEKRQFQRQKYALKHVSAPESKVSASEMTQSKVKESKYILYSDQNKKNGDYVDFDRFQLNDGTVAIMRWGKWVDEKNKEIYINRDGYKELP